MPEHLLDLVHTLQGSNSHFGFSEGNCLPLVARPFGMTGYSPQTSEGGWMFDRRARKLQGVRVTHQPSPWIGDYGHFTVMAQTGRLLPGAEARSSAYRIEKARFTPYLFSAHLIRYNTDIEITPTERCAVFRFHFPPSSAARVLLDPLQGESALRWTGDRLEGHTTGSTGGTPENFSAYFTAEFNCPILKTAAFAPGGETHEAGESAGRRAGMAVEFDLPEGGTVEMKLALSFLSIEQARLSMEQEIGGRGFEEICTEGRRIWEEKLECMEIEGGTEAQRQVFASCLYRVHLFPRKWYELDESGSPVHYSPYDGKAHPGVLYSDNGFWDTYRTVYPLLSLIAPEQLSEILEGWTQAYREGGWFPQWASPGYRACMVGTHADAVMADAIVRGIGGFDRETAYEGLRKHAFEPGDEQGSYGRIGIEEYLEKGYVSTDHHESVARSLDYAYDDFCLAQIAEALGREEDRELFLKRSENYRRLYDSETGFMRGRKADGSWADFREFQWGSPYVEGGAWQGSWAVPHAPQGLIELMGGKEAFTEKLNAMLTMPPHFEEGIYNFEIHEMTEMACADFGQYAHSNQPVHHILYLYTAAGRPDLTHHWVDRVLNELYTPYAFPGDEDNGEMSAWYLLSAIGLFPYCPGLPSWCVTTPLFPRISVRLAGGKTLCIEAELQQDGPVFLEKIEGSNGPIEGRYLSHEAVAQGGILRHSRK